MNDIVDLFNNAKPFDIFEKKDWMIINPNLFNFKTRQISIPINDFGKIFDINTTPIVFNILKDEINQDITKTILKELFSTQNFEYLDIRPDGFIMNGSKYLDKLLDMILNNPYKNLFTTGMIASELQDSNRFTPTPLGGKNSIMKATFYLIGKLSECGVYVDAFMKFDDGRICLFNEVEVNIGKIVATEQFKLGSINPYILIEYDFDFLVGDSKLIFVIENETSEAFNQLISLQRDIKIDKVLE